MNSTNLKEVITAINEWTWDGVYAMRRLPPDEGVRADKINECLRHIWESYYKCTASERNGSEWFLQLCTLIEHAETVITQACREADAASATKELILTAEAHNVPEVARRADELDAAVRASETGDYETTRRIRALVIPFAKEARLEVKRGRAYISLCLIDLAMTTLHEITACGGLLFNSVGAEA